MPLNTSHKTSVRDPVEGAKRSPPKIRDKVFVVVNVVVVLRMVVVVIVYLI